MRDVKAVHQRLTEEVSETHSRFSLKLRLFNSAFNFKIIQKQIMIVHPFCGTTKLLDDVINSKFITRESYKEFSL